MQKKLLLCIIAILSIFTLTSCAAKVFEKEINVVFMYEDEIISNDTVSQFKNAKSPTLPDAYIPDGYKFFGWTVYNPDNVKATDENFKDKYIGQGKMVHYADICNHVENTTVILKALMIDKEEIPVEYHYVVIAWYNKPATSGVDEILMKKLETALVNYLKQNGVSDEDIESIVIRGYTGNVGTTCGAIMEDGDVDIMFAWGSKDNVMNTGGMKEEMLLETVDFNVGSKSRTLHRLTEKETAKLVFTWLQSDECRNIFK